METDENSTADLQVNNAEANEEEADAKLDMLLDIDVALSIELGSKKMQIKDVLKLGKHSVIELDKAAGDPLDFWRVLFADKTEKRLLLFAEMKLPGEAWLEFKIVKDKLYQRAVFRPKGLLGRLYWYSVLPFHAFVFNGMINALVNKK